MDSEPPSAVLSRAADYVAAGTGARVWIEQGWDANDRGQERQIAQHLANQGYDVVLRAASSVGPSPDAWMRKDGRWLDAEFKRIDLSATNIDGAIRSAVREAGHQARVAVIFVGRPDVDEDDAWRAIRQYIRRDRGLRVDDVVLVQYHGRVVSKGWEEVLR